MPMCVAESGGMLTMTTIKNTFLEFVSPAEDAGYGSALRRTNSSPCLTSTSEDACSGVAAAADDDDSSWPDAHECDTESVQTAPSDDSRTTDADSPLGLAGRPPQRGLSDLLQVQAFSCGEKDLSLDGAPKAHAAPPMKAAATPALGAGCSPARVRLRSNAAAYVPQAPKHATRAAPAAPKAGTARSGPRPQASPAPAVAARLAAPVQERAMDHELTPQGSTVMLKVLPRHYSRDMLIELMRSKGFLQHCNFLYLPMNFKLSQNVGYAFLNLTCKEETKRFFDVFEGFSDWAADWDQSSTVMWSDTKGLNANIERYRNSPMMREDVPDMFKPILLSGGQRIAFPSPTKQHLPRIRCRKGHGIRIKMPHSDDSSGQ